MSSKITKETLNDILKDLSKEYRKHSRNVNAEIIMVGGAAILASYNFRSMSGDMDSIIKASSALKDAALIVGDKYNLEKNWLNSDFKRTSSYSDKIYEHSKYYRTFSNVLTVRVIKPEYLLATKLKSARPYKHDLSDIVGIVMEERQNNSFITKEIVLSAFYDMYGENCEIDEIAFEYLEKAFSLENQELLQSLYKEIQHSENQNNEFLLTFEKENPGVLNENNLDEILSLLQDDEERDF